MLALRALKQHAVTAPRLTCLLSTSKPPLTAQQVVDDTVAVIQQRAKSPVNPLRRNQPLATPSNGFDSELPPRAGPEGYASPEQNPLGGIRLDRYSSVQQKFNVAGKEYLFDCHSTRNNTITTLSFVEPSNLKYAPPVCKPIIWYSGGSVGFKKGNRASYEAGYQCAVRVFKLLKKLKEEKGEIYVHLRFRGFGAGREALKTALTTSEGDAIRDCIKRITDRTAIKIGGTRSKKTRRL